MADRLTILQAKAVLLPLNDVDTDQIIPARFLKVTSSSGFGKHLFADLRFGDNGVEKPDFPLNGPGAAGAKILVAGPNFGCGSSREHAAWALRDWGFRAVVSSSFADIFHGNALKNGIVPVTLAADALGKVFSELRKHPEADFTVDVEALEFRWSDSRATFPLEPFARACLLQGVDQLGYLLGMQETIAEFERGSGKHGVQA